MKNISTAAFREVLAAEGSNQSVDFINVCTPAEYREKHIHGVRNVPMDTLGAHLDEFRTKKRIYVHCRSGKRAARAIAALAEQGITAELINVQGGLLAWEESGYDTTSDTSKMPIMRQTFIAAALLILVAHGLFLLIGAHALYLSLIVALGLLFSGITGWCGMALLLARMPWNK